ncbi:MAG: flavodoxin-dependent (E)-4-hydroxy-3-methylbut-2-enyl-diphosphate synthase [Ruminococcaceae bacterium]|nr:flavodoxin-dependent (E)-4-hydroxy-3-methylbut-2-enyl-diphosphate synthase [Oscillospiraceae bacterium]
MKKTKEIQIGRVRIGGGNPIAIQSMTNTVTSDKESTLNQIKALSAAGCDIVRFTVNDMAAAEAIPYYVENVSLPLVADIHFDYKLALAAAERGITKIRINPGNIGAKENIKKVADACRIRNIPIRIGINGGSAEKEMLLKYGGPTAEALAESALSNARMLEECDFDNIVLSVKSSDVKTMIDAARILHEKCNYPLHIGVTETGDVRRGNIKSAIGIGALLIDGIGDTVRVSLTDDPVNEVSAAKDILFCCGIGGGINIVSCPTCGRTQSDVIPLVAELERETRSIKTDKRITVALMGCAVNGPGEAKHADVGVACGNKEGILFRKGEIIKKIPQDEIVKTLIDEIKDMLNA